MSMLTTRVAGRKVTVANHFSNSNPDKWYVYVDDVYAYTLDNRNRPTTLTDTLTLAIDTVQIDTEMEAIQRDRETLDRQRTIEEGVIKLSEYLGRQFL